MRLGEAAAPDVAEQVRALAGAATIFGPLLLAAVGISFCVVVLRFFGGRRGRAFYEGAGEVADGTRGA